MQYEFILMVIPIIIIVAFLVVIAKRMTDGERPDISGAVLGTIIIAVGLLIMVPIIESADPYDYDSETKTFTVSGNITGTDFSWGSAANAENLIIEEGVRSISAGAFASFEDLKYISIPVSIEELGENVFGVTLKDYADQTITAPQAGEYVGDGDGTLYYCDISIFTYSTDGKTITGFISGISSAVNLVFPAKVNGIAITIIGTAAFQDEITVESIRTVPDCEIVTINGSAFQGCTNLSTVLLPTSTENLNFDAFKNCSSLELIDFPDSLKKISSGTFGGTALTALDFPEGLTYIGNGAFQGIATITSVNFPSTLTEVVGWSFNGCTGVTSVSFAVGYSATTDSNSFRSWTFYDSDGTTVIDKTDATALAGFTFQGTASALVKVLPDRSVLTTEQTLQVQELTKAAKTLALEESELQISEKAELAEA